MNEDLSPNAFYPNFYQKINNMSNSNTLYSNYNPYQQMYMNNGNYQNYQYMPNGKPEYYVPNGGDYVFGTMRPHFFSQTNINLDEKKNFQNCSNFKKSTPKKNSLAMRTNILSTPNGLDRSDNEFDFNADSKNLFEFCKDQLGSRRIQTFFEKASEDEKEKLFVKIDGQLLFLIKDVFGNYVVQKMIEKGCFLITNSSIDIFFFISNGSFYRKSENQGDGV